MWGGFPAVDANVRRCFLAGISLVWCCGVEGTLHNRGGSGTRGGSTERSERPLVTLYLCVMRRYYLVEKGTWCPRQS